MFIAFADISIGQTLVLIALAFIVLVIFLSCSKGFCSANGQAEDDEMDTIRGCKAENLKELTNEQLVLLTLANLATGLGLDDEPLVEELKKRAGKL